MHKCTYIFAYMYIFNIWIYHYTYMSMSVMKFYAERFHWINSYYRLLSQELRRESGTWENILSNQPLNNSHNSRDILWKQTRSALHWIHLKWTQTPSDHPKGKSEQRPQLIRNPPQALLLLLKCHPVTEPRLTTSLFSPSMEQLNMIPLAASIKADQVIAQLNAPGGQWLCSHW